MILKTKNHYDVQSQTQFSPGLYELYDGTTLIQSERMDFQKNLQRAITMRCFYLNVWNNVK